MFELYHTKNLQEGEEIRLVVRRYPLTMFWPGLLCSLLILLPFFFLFPLLKLGSWGMAIFFGVGLVGVIAALRLIVLYWYNALLITNRRVIDIDQRGFFHRVVSETTYDKVQDVSIAVRGIAQTLLRCGSVQIQTAGSQANIEVRDVQHPAKVQQLLLSVQAEAVRTPNVSPLENAKMIESVRRAKKELGSDALQQLLDEEG